jgi:hypothetical protein
MKKTWATIMLAAFLATTFLGGCVTSGSQGGGARDESPYPR